MIRSPRRTAGALAVLLACLALGACSDDAGKGDERSSSAAAKVRVPPGETEVDVPKDFPVRIPRPKAPHVVVKAEGQDQSWVLEAAYAKRTNLEAEVVHFRKTVEEKGFTIKETKLLDDLDGSPGTRQASILATSDRELLYVVLTQPKGEQPRVNLTTMGGEVRDLFQ